MRRLKVLPAMQCDVGCGECCGVVPVTQEEYRKILHVAKSKGIVPIHQGVTCPFYQKGTCSVYDARPLSCRMFGHVEAMTCPRGYNTNIPEADVRRMIMANGEPKRVLHDVLIDYGLATAADVEKEILDYYGEPGDA